VPTRVPGDPRVARNRQHPWDGERADAGEVEAERTAARGRGEREQGEHARPRRQASAEHWARALGPLGEHEGACGGEAGGATRRALRPLGEHEGACGRG
jgi:hypothetical protein